MILSRFGECVNLFRPKGKGVCRFVKRTAYGTGSSAGDSRACIPCGQAAMKISGGIGGLLGPSAGNRGDLALPYENIICKSLLPDPIILFFYANGIFFAKLLTS